MSTVPNVSSAIEALLGKTAAPAAGKAAGNDAEQRFLTLLVTQMRNQDPLNPMDNAAVTTQLAQLNTVSGINKLNDTLEALAAGMAATRSLEAAGTIGRSVMVAGTRMELAGGQAVFGVELAQAADGLLVTIRDMNGNIVHSVDAGAQQAGIVALSWDGATDPGSKAADGQYSFSVSASSARKSIEATALSLSRVEGVTTGTDGPRLNLKGGGSVGLTEVKQII